MREIEKEGIAERKKKKEILLIHASESHANENRQKSFPLLLRLSFSSLHYDNGDDN